MHDPKEAEIACALAVAFITRLGDSAVGPAAGATDVAALYTTIVHAVRDADKENRPPTGIASPPRPPESTR